MNEHTDCILQRIKSQPHYQRAWLTMDGLICCGDDFPPGITYVPIGTYDKTIEPEHFHEDVNFARQNLAEQI